METAGMDTDDLLLLKDVIERFELHCIHPVITSPIFETYEQNKKHEPQKFRSIIETLPDIYGDFFYPFLKNIKFGEEFYENKKEKVKAIKSFEALPDSIKFRIYTCDIRHRRKKQQSHPINYKILYLKNGRDLIKENVIKGQLMQGFWQVESMIKEIRNYEEHWKKFGRDFLEKELNRKMLDPLNLTESTGNLLILPSILILMTYNFTEILQTWLDTNYLIKSNNIGNSL
jgi:hypothetical protein